MAAQKKKEPVLKDFKNNPFKLLKGLSALETAPPAVLAKPQVPVKVQEEMLDDDALFEAEMGLLGVSASPDREEGKEIPVCDPPRRVAPLAIPREPQTEQELFLSALGGMDVRFADELPEEEVGQSPSKRMKLVLKGKLLPERKIDLHGLTREEALSRVEFFLGDAHFQGCKLVLVVTGQGRSTGREPVLRVSVEKYLRGKGAELVGEWGRASRHLGGDGALVVFLKKS